MLYGNTVTIQMTQTRHVTHRRAASLLLAALDEPDFSSRTTNPHQSTTFRRRRHTPRSQPESAWIARENRRGESLFFRINYHGGGTSHALYRFEPFPHFSRMPSLSLRAPRPNPPLPFSFCLCNFSLLVTLCCTVTYSRAAYCFLSSPFFFFITACHVFFEFSLCPSARCD